jgi:hypothetical protein
MPADSSQFLDLELLVGTARQPGLYPVTVIAAPAGQASGTLSLDPNAADLKPALDAIADRDTTDELFHEFGHCLFDALLADPIGNLYRTSLGLAQGAGKRLRLRLRIEPPEVSALPWEYLYDPDADLPLAISPNHCLSRYVPISEAVRMLEVNPPLRVLVVTSDPSDLSNYGMPALDASREIDWIQKALRQREDAGQVKTDVLPHAIAADLREKLRTFRPHVIHFIGHGGFQNDQGMLVMEDDERKTRLVSDRQFREFFLGADDAKLVILNACQGATRSSTRALSGLAPQIVRRGLSAVVAMQYPIPDKVALSFAREFYRALAGYYPVDAAVTEGRRAVYMDFGSDRPDWGTPVIFMRSPDGVLFGPSAAPMPQTTQAGTGITIGGTGANLQGVSINISHVDVAGGDIVQNRPVHNLIQDHKRQARQRVTGPGEASGGISDVQDTDGDASAKVSLPQLRETLAMRFSLEELKTMCFDLNVEAENLPPERAGMARELVSYMRRYDRLPELVDYVRRKRPDVGL